MKLNSNLQLATFFISMLMLSACGGGGGGGSTAPVTTPTTMPPVTSLSLDGSWRTRCQASTELTDYDEQQIFNFKGNKLTTNKTFYEQNTNCKQGSAVLRSRIEGGIELGAEVNQGMATRHTKINILRTKVMLVPMNSTLTALLNNSGHISNESIYNGYGQTKWKLFFWKDLSSIEDAKTNFKIDESVPDILQISEKMVDGTTHKVLKLGIKGGNVDSDGRPLALATSITATIQNKTTPTQTAQTAGLIGKWKYNCRLENGNDEHWLRETLNFEGNKLTTIISQYGRVQYDCDNNTEHRLYQVKIEADIVLGKVINRGASNEHTQIGIKTTKIKIKLDPLYFSSVGKDFNEANFYNTAITNLYNGYGQTDWAVNDWKDLSEIPNAIENLNIGTEVPGIFKISTDTGGHKELKMGDYKGNFDINGRAMSLETKGAVFQ